MQQSSDYNFGRWLSSSSLGEEVVISGMAGYLPNSHNIQEFLDHLINQEKMIDDDDRRWKVQHPEIPKRMAKLYDIDRFDAGFFGMHHRQADIMDPMIRTFMEVAIGAIMDAGMSPKELEGTKTGVFVTTSRWDIQKHIWMEMLKPQTFAATGSMRTFIATRVSYFLKLKGPATVIDTACSSSMYALEEAFKAIRSGQIDYALVGSSHILQHPETTLQFSRLGVLSYDGVCRVFDQDGTGYVRGETSACIFLQKSKDARRIYANVVNVKTNSDGCKELGITQPSTQAQQSLITKVYQESGIDVEELSFFEAHGTGTAVGDPKEVEAIDVALAKKRTKQLLVGSVKFNIGHTEPASGICAIIKVLLSMERSQILPNVNLSKIRKGLKGLEERRMKVVTELTTIEDPAAIIGINNFGFGGSNAHAILRRHKKTKLSQSDDIPRLVCASGRTPKAIEKMLNIQKIDVEHIGLLHQVYKFDIKGHLHRGFVVLSKNKVVKTSLGLCTHQTPLYVYFGRFDKLFKVLANFLYKFPFFKTITSKIDKVLTLKKNKSFKEILQNNNDKVLGSICMQIALVDIFKHLDIFPTAVYDDSSSKLISSYYYNVINFEEALLAAVKLSELNFDLDQTHFSELNEEASNKVPKNSIVINFSDYHLNNQALLVVENENVNFLEMLGTLYQHGHNPQIQKLYPEINFPVSRNTSMISPNLEWYHHKKWYTFNFDEFEVLNQKQIEYNISSLEDNYKFISGHVIDGRNIFPATEYLYLVWETIANNRELQLNSVPVVFTDCKFIRAVTMPKSGFVVLRVSIQLGSGYFEVVEKNSLVVTGKVHLTDAGKFSCPEPEAFKEKNSLELLQQDEIYRELYLRGYNQSGAFKGIEKCNIDTTHALIKWEYNWVTFMDQMLQMAVLQMESRLLFVPVGIRKLYIDPAKHLDIAGFKETTVPARCYKESNIIRSGGIEICGLYVKSISKKKPRLEPVLEKHVFVPNSTSLCLEEAARINTQIILENSLDIKFKAVEIVDEATKNEQLVLDSICRALNDMLVVTPDLTVSTHTKIEPILGVKVDAIDLIADSNLLLVVGTNLLQRKRYLIVILAALKKHGFVISRENVNFVPEPIDGLQIFTEYTTQEEKLVLCRKTDYDAKLRFIAISSYNFEWMPKLKTALKTEKKVVVFSQAKEAEGVMGLVNCIRQEPNGAKLHCFFIMDNTIEYDFSKTFFQKQLQKGLAFNILKNHKWGTYRHLILEPNQQIKSKHFIGNVKNRADLSSLTWFQGSLTEDFIVPEGQILIKNQYCAINFKDIMAASGKVSLEFIASDRLEAMWPQGFELAGTDAKGRRLYCMTNGKALSNLVVTEEATVLEFPENWSYEDAATVPVVYITVLYSLLVVGQLRRGVSILIHCATGGIGLAALNISTYFSCDIYVTVGSQEKREYLKTHYPQILESHIGNSRDTSFEDMVNTQTNRKGVDFVLNSLSEDKLMASIRCLAKGGKFLELGKLDLSNNKDLNLWLMKQGVSYHGIMMDSVYSIYSKQLTSIIKLLNDGIKAGYVKPLPRVVFKKEDLEASYRYMMSGKHIGKILIKMQDENPEILAKKTFSCGWRKSYIILGGLGGVGLELADFLVLKGAKKLVLVSRSGLQNGYQNQRIKIWNSYGVKVVISTKDITTKQGCKELLQETESLGSVDAIFNLAVVLKDTLFKDQSKETFLVPLAPKAQATIFLDQLSRELCPKLQHFVIFSSVSCGLGNSGQSNYGMANSIIERICEKRKSEGLPALAIQWGAIQNVGLAARMQKNSNEFVFRGLFTQSISSCMEALEQFLTQEHPVVSSMVVAEKHQRNQGVLSAAEAVATVLGIKNLKTVSTHSTLRELGIDSMTDTEIIQILEKEFEIYLTPAEVRSLTLAKLTEIELNRKKQEKETKTQFGKNCIIQSIPDNQYTGLPFQELKNNNSTSGTVFLFPGLEGVFRPLENFCKHLKAQILGVQYDFFNQKSTVPEAAQTLLPVILERIGFKDALFVFIAYSYGTFVALEVASALEQKGYYGKVVLLDGSPTYILEAAKNLIPYEDEVQIQTKVLLKMLDTFVPLEQLMQFERKFTDCGSFEERIEMARTLIPKEVVNEETFKRQAPVTLQRYKSCLRYEYLHDKIKSQVYLVKAKHPIVPDEDDYQLSKICEKSVVVTMVNGDHATMLNQPELVEYLNKLIVP